MYLAHRVIRAALAVGLMTAAACTSGESATPVPTPAKKPQLLSEYLIRDFEKADPSYAVNDATSLGRFVNQEHTDWYKVCFREKKADGTIRYWVVLAGQKCPARKGDRSPTPQMPDLVGQRPDRAVDRIARDLSYNPEQIHVLKVGQTSLSGELDPEYLPHWRICRQNPAAGQSFLDPSEVILHVSDSKCPKSS